MRIQDNSSTVHFFVCELKNLIARKENQDVDKMMALAKTVKRAWVSTLGELADIHHTSEQ